MWTVPVVEGGESLTVRVHTVDIQQCWGGAIYHDLTLIDSSDDDAPFVIPGSAASPAGPSRRLVLVPGSVDATPQSIQDREWDRGSVETPNIQATVHVPPDSVAEGSEWDTPVDVLPRPTRRLVLTGGRQAEVQDNGPESTECSDTATVGSDAHSEGGSSFVSDEEEEVEVPVVASSSPSAPVGGLHGVQDLPKSTNGTFRRFSHAVLQ